MSINSIFQNTEGGNVFVGSGGVFRSLGHNLFSDAPGFSFGPSDLINTDPVLAPLADNGGPTMTMALLPGSPAIDAGVSVPGVTTDQRGIPRPQGSAPDIGAFEVQFGLVVTAQPPGSVTAGSGFGLTVAAEDSSGHVETSYNGTVTVALSNNPSGATLGGTLSVTAQNGVATFSGLTLDKAGTGYRLSIGGRGLIPTTTNAFDVTPAPATVLPPILVGMQSLVNPQSPTSFVLSFSQPMDVARAQDSSNYRLVWAGRDHRLGTKDDQAIPIRWARYDAASWSVKLRLLHRQPQDRTLWLTVASSAPGGLTNAVGTPLAGVATGGPGGAQPIRLDLKALRIPMRMGLLPDGGFETPRALPPDKGRMLTAGHRALAPWRITAGSVNVQTYWPVAEGTHTLDLNGVSAGTIEQSFATIPGQVYQLLFDYANNPDRPARTATAAVTVTGVGTLLSRVIAHAGSTPRNPKYMRFLATFIADSATTTLSFASTTPGAYGIILDAVSVMAVPGTAATIGH
jgi:choice-of-anchor C domain-containing protein